MYPAKEHVLKTFHRIIALLPESEKTKPQVLLLAGEVTPYRNDTDREMPFRQESNFYYLSGCTIPGSFILAAYQPGTSLAQTPSIDLFIPKAEQADLMWSVPPPLPEAAFETHDVTHIDHPAALPAAIHTLIKALPGALFHTLPRASPLFPVLQDAYTAAVLAPENADGAVSDNYLLSALHRARLTKDDFEVAAIRHANAISSRAHEVVMRVLGLAVKHSIHKAKGSGDRPHLPGEWLIEKEAEAEAVFVASCRREGAVHQAYLPIVAASTRASTLHYCCNDREFAWGPVHPHDQHNKNAFAHGGPRELNPQVLLIDAGCEWNCYAADITRTMPVGNGGKFTTEARAIYELVLEMQKASFSMLAPELHWDAVQLICHRTLIRGFQRLGIFKSPNSPGSGSWNAEEAILASGISSAFFPHGVGHSLGLDVHDVPSASKPVKNDTITDTVEKMLGHPSFYEYLRLRLPLEAGMVVTVEPGIYFSPHLLAAVRDSKHIDHEVLARYESVGGVRIEDAVLITATGYENLTTVRSDTEWIEAVCSGEA
ncbi:putative Xaa-Pro aminopeptidase PEPP [Hypsizygus marmoreus]|uniref:Xaa-Pro aminopeptidase PEPP n=1 Tax=Hypsizygus marmoreus TaxID=39966 RepID=A0A369JQC7_HYPMA|nr:putative Xaa-Pro aminopeptidase PEPP [Hypsizygus marmoreus]